MFTVSIATLALLMAADGTAPQADAGAWPARFPPSSFRDPSDLARSGHAILAKTTGDLDGDGRPDIAVALKGTGGGPEVPSWLILGLGQSDGSFKTSFSSAKAILSDACIAYPSGFSLFLKLTRNALTLTYSGGNMTGGTIHLLRARLDVTGWRIVGYTSTREDAPEDDGPEASQGDTYKADWNLSTGVIEQTEVRAAHPRRRKRSFAAGLMVPEVAAAPVVDGRESAGEWPELRARLVNDGQAWGRVGAVRNGKFVYFVVKAPRAEDAQLLDVANRPLPLRTSRSATAPDGDRVVELQIDRANLPHSQAPWTLVVGHHRIPVQLFATARSGMPQLDESALVVCNPD